MSGEFIPAAMKRALIRTQKHHSDITKSEAIQRLLRELFDGEGLYLKEVRPRRIPSKKNGSR